MSFRISDLPLNVWLVVFILTAMFAAEAVAAENLPTGTVSSRDYPRQYQFDARIEAVNRATVSSRIAAEVIEINFDVDDRVPKDAVILRFRDEEIKARLTQAEANLLAEKAQHQEALARQKEALAEAGRIADLFERKQVTRAALDKTNADKAAANARVAVLAAQIKARQAQVEEAQVQLSYTTIRAPYAGVVTKRLIEVGEMASPGQLLMSGVSLENLRAVVSVPQRLIDPVIKADSVFIFNQAGQKIDGSNITLVPQADPASHNFDVRVSLPGAVDKLYPGSMVKIRFLKGQQTLTVMPQAALVQRSEVSGVYVLVQERIMFRQIRTGQMQEDGWIEVLAGLRPGDEVITDPQIAVQQLKQKQYD